MVNKEFHLKNRKRLMSNISDKSLIILFSGEAPRKSADQRHDFVPNRNFYYLTGMDRQKMALIIAKFDHELEEILFIEKPDSRKESRIGKMLDIDRAKAMSGILDVRYIDSLGNSMGRLLNNTGALIERDYENLYLDFEVDDWDASLNYVQAYAKKMKEKFPYLNIKNIHSHICNLRVIKTQDEIEKIRKAIHLTNEGLKNILRNMKPGVKEYELEAEFDYALKKKGVKTTAFKTIAASGSNAVVLHYEDNDCLIDEKDLVLFDLGAEYDYYSADISRTYPTSGKFTERQKILYNIVLRAQEETINAMNPGVDLESLINVTKKVLIEECKKIKLIENDEEIAKYFFHGVSHYLGLDTHDVGNRNVKLKPGMVLTVEPGLYITEEGIGIRIEDDVLITENGHEVLSKEIIKSVEDIEDFIRKERDKGGD